MKTKKINIFALIFAFCLISSTAFSGIFSSPIRAFTYTPVKAETTADFEITDASTFDTFARAVSNGNSYSGKLVVLKTNVNLSSFSGVGKYTTNSSSSNKYFSGTFDGGNFSITGLRTPLFNCTKNAKLMNIYIDGGNISKSAQSVGGIVCYAVSTTITKCKNTAGVSNNYTSGEVYAGGIVGYAQGGSISECSNEANIINTSSNVSKSYVGGIVGFSNSKVENSYVYNSTITANAKTTTQSAKNDLSGNKKSALTHLGAYFDNAVEKYISDREKLYSDNEKKNSLISDYFAAADQARNNYKVYGAYVLKMVSEQIRYWGITGYSTKKIFGIKVSVPNFGWKYTTIKVPKMIWDATAVDWVKTAANKIKLEAKAASAWFKLGLKGDWATAFKAGWNTIKANLATNLKNALQNLYQTVKSITGNNHYSFVNSKTKAFSKTEAYALGIGYATVSKCYTAAVTVDAPENNYTYNYSFTFTNEFNFILETGPTLRKASTSPISVTVKQQDNHIGLLGTSSSSSYFYGEEVKNLGLYISASNMKSSDNLYGVNSYMSNTYKMSGDSFSGFGEGWFDKQNFKISYTKQGQVSFSAAKNGNGSYAKISTPNVTTDFPSEYKSLTNGSQANKGKTLPSGLSSTYWAIDENINNGYPHLKYRYWQDIV